MSHEPYEAMLNDYSARVLPEQEAELLEAHLLTCGRCCEQLELQDSLRAHAEHSRSGRPAAVLAPGVEAATDSLPQPDYLKLAAELLGGTQWEPAVEKLRGELRRGEHEQGTIKLEGERLLVLLHASELLNSTLSFDTVVPRLMGLVLRCVRAERSIVFVLDRDGELQPFPQPGIEPECLEDAKRHSTNILKRAAEDLHVLWSGNAMTDPTFSQYESVTAFAIKSFLCVPIKCRGTVTGTLYVDNRSLVNAFDQQDLEFVRILANHAGIAIENARLHDQLKLENQELSTELTRSIGERILEDPLQGNVDEAYERRQRNREVMRKRALLGESFDYGKQEQADAELYAALKQRP